MEQLDQMLLEHQLFTTVAFAEGMEHQFQDLTLQLLLQFLLLLLPLDFLNLPHQHLELRRFTPFVALIVVDLLFLCSRRYLGQMVDLV